MNEIKEWVTALPWEEIIRWGALGAGVTMSIGLILLGRWLIKNRDKTPSVGEQRRMKLLFVMALAINADAMFRVAVEKLELPWWFAIAVFAFFELTQLFFMGKGERDYRETGSTKGAASIVWLLALASSSITLANAHNPTEAVLRVVLPIVVAAVWQRTLRTEIERPESTQFIWSRDRIMVTLGIKEPAGDIDYGRISRARKIRKLATLCDQVLESDDQLTSKTAIKLNRMLATAEPAVLDGVVAQREAAQRARVRLGLAPDLEVPTRPTSAPGTQVGQVYPEVGTSGTPGTGSRVGLATPDGPTSGRAGTGTPESGTDEDPIQVLGWQVVRWARENGRFPGVGEIKKICGVGQDKAQKARAFAMPIWLDEENAKIAAREAEDTPGE